MKFLLFLSTTLMVMGAYKAEADYNYNSIEMKDVRLLQEHVTELSRCIADKKKCTFDETIDGYLVKANHLLAARVVGNELDLLICELARYQEEDFTEQRALTGCVSLWKVNLKEVTSLEDLETKIRANYKEHIRTEFGEFRSADSGLKGVALAVVGFTGAITGVSVLAGSAVAVISATTISLAGGAIALGSLVNGLYIMHNEQEYKYDLHKMNDIDFGATESDEHYGVIAFETVEDRNHFIKIIMHFMKPLMDEQESPKG